LVNGSLKSFEYKLLNYLIQGSASDQTKQSIIDWDKERRPDDIFLAALHDEVDTSMPAEDWKNGMEILRVVMEAPRFDVPFRSEGFSGPNFGSLHAA
jgi:DNA polymerase I-like protein with 3'-5' exonuclease and polymerase domains